MIVAARTALASLCLLVATGHATGDAAPPIRLDADGSVVVGGIAGPCGIEVSVDRVGPVPALLGEAERDGADVRFRPRFPLRPGLTYKVSAGGVIVGRFTVPPPAGEPPAVTAVYPSADTLPENLLRFTIQFSRPMARGDAYAHVRLLDADGRRIADPFLELGEELWDPTGQRFTLLFDPGRVKRGLVPHEEAGPVLVAGKSYRLEIAAGWQGAEGRPTTGSFIKDFRAGEADRQQPDPDTWQVTPPAAGTRDALVVRFPEPLDHNLLHSALAVAGVPGEASVAGGETVWQFVPDAEWSAGSHALRIGTELEDRAGNSVRKPFEVADRSASGAPGETVTLPFEIVGAPDGIVWHATLPGDGASTPLVLGEHIFLTSQLGSGPVASFRRGDTAAPAGDGPIEFVLSCRARADGSPVWERRWPALGELEAVHPLHNLATPTCATDGDRVVALFGTGQLFCLDLAGTPLWQRHLGEQLHPFALRWGHSSSPVIHDGMLYLLCDHDPAACLVALDLVTGDEIWRVDRGSGLRSYSTPVVAAVDGRWQLVVNSNPGIDGYDAATGEPLWSWREFCKVPVPVPTVEDGIMVASRGYTGGPIMRLDLRGLTGDVPASAADWRWASRAPYVSSPLIDGDLLYLSTEEGQVYCIDASSGELVWSEKLGTCFWSTPAAGADEISFLDESGEVIGVARGRDFALVRRTELPGDARGSVVIDRRQCLVRTSGGLFCLEGR